MIQGFLIRMLLVLPPALLCGLQNNDLFVPLCTLLLLIPLLLTKKRLPPKILNVAMFILPAASLAFLPMLFSGSSTNIIYSDLRFFLPMCCYCATLFLYLGNVTPACITEIIVFLLLARPGAPINSLLRSELLQPDTVFTAVVFICATAAVLLFSEQTPGNRNAIRLRIALLLLPLPCLMLVFNGFYQDNQHVFRSWNLRGKFHAMRQQKPNYAARNESDINQPFMRDPDFEKRILFYAESDVAPGYLKLNTFELYRRGVWKKPYMTGEELLYNIKNHTSVYQLSPETERKEDQKSMTVYPVEHALFNQVALPENTYALELVAEKTFQMPWGDLAPVQWDRNAAYTVHYSTGNKPGIREIVPPSKRCLHVPRSLRAPLQKLLYHSGGILDGAIIRNDRELALHIARYLQNNYRYSLVAPDPDSIRHNQHHDPIFRFLFATKEGHCELFASSCTMLLRSAGLNARYVNGFVCRRRLDHDNNIWFSTGFDYHAWTEVYLDDEQRWIRIDATPGSDDMEIVVAESTFGDRFSLLKKKISAYFRNGDFMSLLDEIGELPWQYLLLLPLIGGGVLILIRLRRKNRSRYTLKISRSKRLASKKFMKEAGKIMKKSGIKRKHNETFREWMNRLDEADRTALLPSLHEYEKQRFSD